MRPMLRTGAVAGSLLLCLFGCAKNSVTGRRQVVLTSAAQETEAGASEAKRVSEEIGLVDDPQLADYVSTLGARLVQQLQSNDFTYTFHVVDMPEPNAFALPGGFIYVSRGMLTLVNSEDELVTVLGHEIGHVAARHASRRLTLAAPFAIATGISSFATSIVSPKLGNVVAGIGGMTGSLVVAPYSREQEREADRLGMQLAARAGWNPGALSKILATMEQEERLHGGGADRFSFFASHPSTPERVRDTAEEAARLGIGVHSPVALDRAAVLAHFDGLLVGHDPAAGVFVGPRFLHPELDFAVDFPSDWKTQNDRAYVTAVAPDGDALSILRAVGNRGEFSTVVQKTAKSLGYDPNNDVEWTTIAGNKAARLQAEGRTDDGTPVQMDLTWIAYRSGIFEIAGVSTRASGTTYSEALRGVSQSFRPLATAERSQIHATRLRLQTAHHRDTVDGLATRITTTWSAEEIAVVNGVAVDRPLTDGFVVKVAIQEAFERATR